MRKVHERHGLLLSSQFLGQTELSSYKILNNYVQFIISYCY